MNILILGAKGTLGGELARHLNNNSEARLAAWDLGDLDITDNLQTIEAISRIAPDIIFNCAAYNFVDKAEDEPEKAMQINFHAVENLARAASKCGAVFVHYSTGYVFDGEKRGGYDENDKPNPKSVYANSKYLGEQAALSLCPKTYLIRLNQLFGGAASGSSSKKSFVDIVLRMAESGKREFDFVDDEISTRAYAPDLAKASIELAGAAGSGAQKYPYGIYHLTNEGCASWCEWAREILEIARIPARINAVKSDSFPRKAARPKNSSLNNNKFPKLRNWREALKEYIMGIQHP